MSYWRTFVAVTKDHGTDVLMISDRSGNLIFPEFYFDDLDAQMHSIKYREKLYDCLGVKKSVPSAVVDVHDF